MTDQEHEIRQQLAIHDAKFMMIMDELKQQREDMRRAREKHDADMRQLQERQDVMQAKHDAEMKDMREKHDADMHEMNQRFYDKFDAMDKKIDNKFDKLSEQIHTMTIAAVAGFGAILVAIGGIIFTALK